MNLNKAFRPVADFVAKWTGKPFSFIACVALVALWGLTGPLFKFSDTWQLVINTSTTIVTFLMVFLIQNTQNRDNLALQAKLDELIRVGRSSNTFIGIEHLTDDEIEALIAECEEKVRARKATPEQRVELLTEMAKAGEGPRRSGSRKTGGDKLSKAREAAKARSAKKPVKTTVRRG